MSPKVESDVREVTKYEVVRPWGSGVRVFPTRDSAEEFAAAAREWIEARRLVSAGPEAPQYSPEDVKVVQVIERVETTTIRVPL